MFTRVFLNITKHKILNILLIFLLIISFVGITFSSVYVYKTTSFLNEVYDSEDYIILSSEDYQNTDSYNIGLDVKLSGYVEIYEKYLLDNNKYDTKVDMMAYTMEFTNFSDFYQRYADETKILNYIYNEEQAMQYFDLEEGYDTSKVYISEDLAKEYGYSVGDKLELGTITGVDLAGDTIYSILGEFEIGEIYESKDIDKESGDDSYEESIIYIPFDCMLDVDVSQVAASGITMSITGSDEDIAKLYEDVKDYSNDVNVYYSSTYEDKDLEFFKDIRNFFVIILIATIGVFTLSMLSLNNNIMERRNDEFRLYNVFGVTSKDISIQLVVEKVILFIIALVFAIPMFINLLRVGNNIVDNLVQYSLNNDMILGKLIEATGNLDLFDKINNGISAVEVNRFLIVIFGITVMLIIIIIITLVQFILRRNNIVNQRRGE